VFEDRCPHRNVPLSEGRIEEDGTLMCSYHGWRFDSDGKVCALPQAKEEQVQRLLENPRACASSRPAQVKEGVLWVWGDSSPDAALESALQEPILPEEMNDPAYEGRWSFSTWSHRDIPYGWEVAMENVTDPAHVDVSHHNIVANRYEDPSPIEIDFLRKPTNKGGFKVEIKKLQSEEVKAKKGTSGVITTNDFKPPHAIHIKSEFPSGASLTLVINFVPTKPGWSRLVGSTFMVEGRNGEKPKAFSVYTLPLPRWFVHLMAPAFLHQDQVFLHFQQSILQKEMAKSPGKSWMDSYWIPTEADKMTVTMRRWLDKNDGVGWCPSAKDDLSALPDVSLLFDTYKTHTSQCTTCMKALRNTVIVQKVLKYSAVTMVAAGVATSSWGMIAGSGVLGFGYQAASKLKKMFYEVPYNHQDNR
jgi:phenylpropionate dioxygenase-like ring-hydroxylating dioxygenase large terminal subunit